MNQLNIIAARSPRGRDTAQLSRRALIGGLGALAIGSMGGTSAHAARRKNDGSTIRKATARTGGVRAPKAARHCTGLGARSFSTAQRAQRDVISFVVVDFEWRDLHAGPGRVSTAFRDQLRQQLDWCHSSTGVTGKRLQVRLRPRMGIYAPQWVKDRTGSMRWYTDKGTDGTGVSARSNPLWREIPGGTPIWWNHAYRAAAYDFYSILAREFGSHPALSEVVMGWPSTQFVEPCNKQFGLDENLAAAVASGYTDEADDAMFLNGWQAHKALLSPLGISCYTAFNPPGKVTDGDFKFGNVERCVTLMRQQVSTLGAYAVVANNSWAPYETQSLQYKAMYNEHQRLHKELGARIAFQTETFERLLSNTTVRSTIDEAVLFGATGIELPRGCETAAGNDLVDAAYAIRVSSAFAGNS